MMSIDDLAKESIQEKLKELPDSKLMRVDEVADILLDLQQDLLLLTSASVSEPALASSP